MTSFTLDTSGVVSIPSGPYAGDWTWETLPTDFLRGYGRAALAQPIDVSENLDHGAEMGVLCGFRHLAPSTLEAMMKDCGRFQARPANRWIDTEVAGFEWFRCVQRGDYAHIGFPPQILSLGDDGLIYQREAV